jgi:cysteine synthase A
MPPLADGPIIIPAKYLAGATIVSVHRMRPAGTSARAGLRRACYNAPMVLSAESPIFSSLRFGSTGPSARAVPVVARLRDALVTRPGINLKGNHMTVSQSTLDVVGNTPVVALRSLPGPNAATVLVKLEYYNPTGSYKDRMARAIIEGAERRGDLRPGMSVVEVSGGSTGSSLAFICAQKGYPLKVVTSDAFAQEKLSTMAAFGAELIIEPSDNGQITPELIQRAISRASSIAEAEGAYQTNQFHNEDALMGYREMVSELADQIGGTIDVFCGGVGTGGMLAGVSRAFRDRNAGTRIIALEPASSPILSQGRPGSHRIEGVGIGFAPPLLKPDDYDEVRAVDEQDARRTARRLAREEGIFAGTSSGMNVAAAVELARELGSGRTVVTVAVDFGLKYLAGDLFEA